MKDDGKERSNRHAYSPVVSHLVAFFATSPGLPGDNSARRPTPLFEVVLFQILKCQQHRHEHSQKTKVCSIIDSLDVNLQRTEKDAASTEQE